MYINLDYPKVIGDPIHGYIPLTRCEHNLLQLPVTNRLHYIKQNSLAYLVFPGAVTTRFSHVIGALHIGGKLVSQILSKIDDSLFKEMFPDIRSPEFIIKSVRLACLMHDIGHGPFSHSAEEAMLTVTRRDHYGEIEEAKNLFDKEDESKIPIHEFFSYKLVTNGEIYAELLQENRDDGGLIVESVSSLLVKSNTKLVKTNPGYVLLRKLISSQLDADRMDYLLRDSAMSGVKFGLVDVDRIINNMKIINNNLAIHERALGAIEDMLDARYKMYRWFYSHHTNAILDELIGMAIDVLVRDDRQMSNLFHWSSYQEGSSTDYNILDHIGKNIKDPNYERFKGIFDRRYLPVSLLKSTPELGRLVQRVVERSSIKESLYVVKHKIISFFGSNGSMLLRKRLEMEDNLRDCLIIQADVNMKPYEPFSQKDKVYLYRDNESHLCELWSESGYFRKINEEWKEYHGLYLYYLFPGKQKKEFYNIKDHLLDIIAEEIGQPT